MSARGYLWIALLGAAFWLSGCGTFPAIGPTPGVDDKPIVVEPSTDQGGSGGGYSYSKTVSLRPVQIVSPSAKLRRYPPSLARLLPTVQA